MHDMFDIDSSPREYKVDMIELKYSSPYTNAKLYSRKRKIVSYEQ